MTPREKAQELYKSFIPEVRWKMGQEDYKSRAKRCALITINEILNTIEFSSQADELSKMSYWNEVKKEIAKL